MVCLDQETLTVGIKKFRQKKDIGTPTHPGLPLEREGEKNPKILQS